MPYYQLKTFVESWGGKVSIYAQHLHQTEPVNEVQFPDMDAAVAWIEKHHPDCCYEILEWAD